MILRGDIHKALTPERQPMRAAGGASGVKPEALVEGGGLLRY